MRLLLTHTILAVILVYALFQRPLLEVPYSAMSAVIIFAALFTGLWLSSYFYRRSYFLKIPKLVRFILFFIKELFAANLKIAYDIITPRYRMQPTVMAFPLEARSDLSISLLANMIGLTPGTLSIDLSSDRSTLYIHTLYLKNGDVEQLRQHIKNGYERRILELTT